MPGYNFYITKYDTNMTAFYEICARQAPLRNQCKLVKIFHGCQIWLLPPPDKKISCQRNFIQLSTDVQFHAEKEEPEKKIKKKSKFTSAWILQEEGKKEMFQIIFIVA